ncbi:hemolysin [Fusobacterium polymorphum]|uniref:Hemolysin n=2 Tax=Fusobacterium nucleatum subsp. polymorphum TaxID=76857 RepID=A0A2C6AU22_FUSNP|nr:hemolysin [Fusobacterium polymorphum]
MEELSRQFKAREINEKQLKEAARDIVKGYGKDIGIDYEVVYLDESTMPKDAKGSTGSAYILDEKNRKVLIPIDVKKIKDTGDLFGTIAEEVSHGKDALEGRQDKKVAEDKGNKEKGLESLGRPANDYVKNKLGDDNNSNISLTTDGIDLTNADVGEKVGDVNTQDDRNGGYAEILPSQQKDPWLNKIHFKLLRLRKNTDEFSEKVLITSFYINTKISSMLFDPEDKTIREFTLGALKAGGEDLSLNTYKIPKRFQYNTLPYKYGELFGHSTMSALGILGNITGSGMEGGGTAAALPTGGGSLGVVALGAGVQTYSVGVIGTSAINSAKVGLDIKAMKSEGGSSDNNSNKSIEDTKNLEKELEELKDGWGKGSFSDKEATIEYHYKKHKEEVGADSLLQYLRKAKAFSKNLRGAKKSNVMGATKEFLYKMKLDIKITSS